MKRGRIIIGVLIAVFVFVLIVSMIDEQAGDSEENILRTVMDKSNLIKWLYSDSALGIGYGECVFDSDCDSSITDIRKCGGNNIVQEITEKKCEGGKCVERMFSQIIERCSGDKPLCSPVTVNCVGCIGEIGQCEACDASKNPPEIVFVEGKPCKKDGWERGVCSKGECKVANCETLSDNFKYTSCPGKVRKDEETGEEKPPIINTCCAPGEQCWGKGTSRPICCEEGEYGVAETDFIYLKKIADEFERKGISLEKAKKLDEISKKHGVTNLVTALTNKDFYNEVKKAGLIESIIPITIALREIDVDPDSKSYFCQKSDESCKNEGKKLCYGTRGSACCKTSDSCVPYISQAVKFIDSVYGILNIFRDNPRDVPEISIGFCGSSLKDDVEGLTLEEKEELMKKSCPEGTDFCQITELAEYNGGVLCCDTLTENCVNRNPYGSPTSVIFPFYPPSCQPKSCGKGYTECTYGGFLGKFNKENTDVLRLCCQDGIETCLKEPIPYIRCINLAKKIGNPSKTKSTSVYMIRSEENFVLDGKVYVIEPSIKFKKDITITLEEEIVGGEDVFKYDNHIAVLESCEVEKMGSITLGIGSQGGIIGLEGEISVMIPNEALDSDFDFTVTSYELSNCHEVGKKLFVGYPEDGGGSEETPSETDDLNWWVIGSVVGIIILILIILFRKKLF